MVVRWSCSAKIPAYVGDFVVIVAGWRVPAIGGASNRFVSHVETFCRCLTTDSRRYSLGEDARILLYGRGPSTPADSCVVDHVVPLFYSTEYPGLLST